MLKCKYCESDNTIKKGIKYNKQEYYCKDCKKYFQEGPDRRLKRDIKERENEGRVLEKSSLLEFDNLCPNVCRRKTSVSIT